MGKPTTKKLVIENIFAILVLVSFIVQIVITFYLRKIEKGHFEYLQDNWETPFESLYVDKISWKNSSCEENEANLLENIYFEGTVEGGKNFNGEIIRIPEKEASYGVNAIHKVDFKIKTINQQYFCSKIEDNTDNYFSLRRGNMATLTSTPIGTDSLGNLLFHETLNGAPVKQKNGNDSNFLYVDLILSEKTPCMNPNYGNQLSGLNKLDYHYDKNECPKDMKYDENNIKVFAENISKEQLLKENGILEKLQKLPEYNTDSFKTTKLKLYGVPYIGLDMGTPFTSDNKEDIKKYLNNLDSMDTFNAILIAGEICFFFIYLVKYTVLIVKANRQKTKAPVYVKPCLMIISVVDCIIVCIFFSKVVNKPEIIEAIQTEGHFDPNYYELLKPTFDTHKTILTMTYICLVINILLAIKYGIRTAIKLAS